MTSKKTAALLGALANAPLPLWIIVAPFLDGRVSVLAMLLLGVVFLAAHLLALVKELAGALSLLSAAPEP